jgi:hypothetical protein
MGRPSLGNSLDTAKIPLGNNGLVENKEFSLKEVS